MNRRAMLSGLSALPALIVAKVASATQLPALPEPWAKLEADCRRWVPDAKAEEIRRVIVRAQAAGLDRHDLSAVNAEPLALCFGSWSAGTFATVEASRVLRWNVEGPAERWG